MAIRSYKPTSPGRRFVTSSDFKELTANRPEKKLTEGKKRSSGRNSDGRITSRHRGRGHKRLYRIIDFRRFVCIDKHRLDRPGDFESFRALFPGICLRPGNFKIPVVDNDPAGIGDKDVGIRFGTGIRFELAESLKGVFSPIKIAGAVISGF